MAEFATGIIASFSRVKTLRGTQLFKGKLIVNVLTNEVQRRRGGKTQRIISSICTLCHKLAVNRTHVFFFPLRCLEGLYCVVITYLVLFYPDFSSECKVGESKNFGDFLFFSVLIQTEVSSPGILFFKPYLVHHLKS